MPRAFLITRRRYNGTGEFEEGSREYSPERGVRLAEYGGGQHSTSDGASECGSESSNECPEELYNLTKLAEVSLAAAAGTLVHPVSAGLYHPRPATLQPLREAAERTRVFFDRIESERESLVELKTRRMSGDEGADALLEGARLLQAGSYADEFKSENAILTDTTTLTPTSTATFASVDGKRSPSIAYQSPEQPSHASQQSQQDGVEEHECPECGKKYSTSSNLARHRQTHRSLGDKKARRCPHCDKVYVSIPAYSMHVRTHNQGCKCHFCGKCFSRPWLLQGHIRTHTGEKPFKCTICNKAFADKSNLRAHIQTHSNTKPHVCSRCGKAFALKSYLYKHEESSCMRTHHHQQREKRESSTSPVGSGPSCNSAPPQLTASPTSVIVQPRNFQNPEPQSRHNSAFSAIIQHTRTTHDNLDHDSKVKNSEEAIEVEQSKDLLSRMMVRSSVISPNPEHVARYSEKKTSQHQRHQQDFDFNDPARVSAFSRPSSLNQAMTLNLALA